MGAYASSKHTLIKRDPTATPGNIFFSEAIWWITVALLLFTASAMAQGVAPIQLENGEKIIQHPIRFRISVSCHMIFTDGSYGLLCFGNMQY